MSVIFGPTSTEKTVALKKYSKTLILRNTRRGEIRLERYSATDFRVQIFAPLAGTWEQLWRYRSHAAASRAFRLLFSSMTRRSS